MLASAALAIPIEQVAPGQLLISEIMPNPAGDDTFQEWFEVLNPLPVAVDLSGMIVIGDNGGFILPSVGPAIAAGGHFLFARSGDAATNGGLPTVGFAWGQALTLRNSDGQLSLARPDGTVIVNASWTSTDVGVSLELAGGTAPSFGHADFVSNALTQYSGQTFVAPSLSPANSGTPGAPNTAPMSVANAPQLLISEVMANPTGSDALQEWFEVLNASPDPVDLDGMVFSTASGSFTVVGAHVIPSGGFFLFARTDDPTLNGGLPEVGYAWGQALTLANSNGQLSIVGPGGDQIVSASWSSTTDGRSLELTGGTGPAFGPADFSVAALEPQYSPVAPPPSGAFANFGTPGADNIAPLQVTGIPTFEVPVPEPSGLALLLSALMLWAWPARRSL